MSATLDDRDQEDAEEEKRERERKEKRVISRFLSAPCSRRSNG